MLPSRDMAGILTAVKQYQRLKEAENSLVYYVTPNLPTE